MRIYQDFCTNFFRHFIGKRSTRLPKRIISWTKINPQSCTFVVHFSVTPLQGIFGLPLGIQSFKGGKCLLFVYQPHRRP
ncbi:MAG: hypothetical protein PWQ91_324 [Eubacteriales bacterium]|nr:hypothetical protein [Eubacteriales bacterium]MDN5363263.1 hypothetical protein [Eubacteriales bacterium]